MDSDRIKTGLYNRAKNSNNNSNYVNPVSNKARILNANSLNFMKNPSIDEENENEQNEENLNPIKNSAIENNSRLILPNINQNKLISSKFDGSNKTKTEENTNSVKSNKQNLLDNYDSKLLLKQNQSNKAATSSIFNNDSNNKKNAINLVSTANSKRIPSSKNLLNSKQSQINKTTNNNISAINSTNSKNLNSVKEEKTQKAPVAAKKPTVRKFKSNIIKEYLKESSIKSIQLFLDPKSLKNFILACKKFYSYCLSNDDLWFVYYTKKFKIAPTRDKYSENMGKWREVFLKSLKKIFAQNYESIKNKFLKNFNKNKYQVSKDPYNIANLVYHNMKPSFNIEIDGKLFPVKHIFTNKILSHINFFINFDQEFLEYRKANKIKLYLNEKNLGLSDVKIFEIELKKKKFLNLESEGIKPKICSVFAYGEFIFSTFEKNFIFFINISLPICKICEVCFDFLKGIHGKNLLYEDDISRDFGLYEYVLLLNVKSWKEIFFTMHVNKLDFKRDSEDNEYIYYENDYRMVCNTRPNFPIQTICLNEKIENFLILDIMMLTYNGDHMICDSHPCILKKSVCLQYDEFDYEYYNTQIQNENYNLEINYKFSKDDSSLFMVDNFKLAVKAEFVAKIFKQ